jgi:hypothetical protein
VADLPTVGSGSSHDLLAWLRVDGDPDLLDSWSLLPRRTEPP